MANYDKQSFLQGLVNNLIIKTTLPAGLEDFYYSENADGTYTILGWKGTYQGKSSSKCVIPDNPLIILNLQ